MTRSFSHFPRQSDLLQWILDIAVPEKETDFDIAARLMSINLASIHTTSMVSQEVSSARILQVFDCSSAQSVTIALFLLAQNPEYIEPLRAEIRSVIEEEGWTKAALDKMRFMDSFFKESQRYDTMSTSACLLICRFPSQCANNARQP